MPNVARVDDSINPYTTSSNQCYQPYSYSCNCDEYGCSTCTGYYYSSASGSGKISSGSSNVFVNGKKLAYKNSTTSEQATCPSGYSGSSSGNGSVTSGSGTVYVNGNNVAFNGSSVRTHTGQNSSINSGSNNVFVGG